MDAIELRNELIHVLAGDNRILGIGQTGSLNPQLIPGKSDIDLFVLCTDIPTEDDRRGFYQRIANQQFDLYMSVCSGGQWGYGDILVVGGIDVMPMYFTVQEMQVYLSEVLSGMHMDKDGRFYPVGRLASISTIHILHEKAQTWSAIKAMVNQKPETFFRQWFDHEISQVIDEEDLGRCELRREVLFFHQVLENALDHLLQALYAVNRQYFPSRKRTLNDINAFDLKPEDCGNRMLRMVQHGSTEDGICLAIAELRQLAAEVACLGVRPQPVVSRYQYVTLQDVPAMKHDAARWFSRQWGVPESAYLQCMDQYLCGQTPNAWYLCLYDGRIVGGLGVIDNDFHDRKDLAPNVCAVYTEEAHRGQGIAGKLLNLAVDDMRAKGVSPLYLVTDHTGFYERYGWTFLCMVQPDDEPGMSRLYIHR